MQHDQYEPWDSGTYRTGSTTPPKGYSRLVAILLIIVVLLAGLVSILSVLNIRLFAEFRALQQPENIPLSLEIGQDNEQELTQEETEPASVSASSIGIEGKIIAPLYQKYFQLPQGLLITHVSEGSQAEEQGILEGDVLTYVNNMQITDIFSFKTALKSMIAEKECHAIFFRKDINQDLRITFILEPDEP